MFQNLLTEEEQAYYLKLNSKQLVEYKEIFDIFDADDSGSIDNEEITKVMQALGENVEKTKVIELIRSIDYDENGQVDFNEFVCLMVKILTSNDKNLEEKLVSVFHRFDANGDGEVTWSDLVSIFTELGHEIDEDEAKEMIHTFDEDDDGSLNLQEFVQTLMFDTRD